MTTLGRAIGVPACAAAPAPAPPPAPPVATRGVAQLTEGTPAPAGAS